MLAPAVRAAGLEGTQVSVTAYCCTAPIESNQLTKTVSATVGGGTEFAAGSLPNLNPFQPIITSDIDVSGTQIDLTYTVTAVSGIGTFNGLVFDFAGLGAERISGATLNPLSSFLPASVQLGFDTDTVRVSLPGLSFVPGTQVSHRRCAGPGAGAERMGHAACRVGSAHPGRTI